MLHCSIFVERGVPEALFGYLRDMRPDRHVAQRRAGKPWLENPYN